MRIILLHTDSRVGHRAAKAAMIAVFAALPMSFPDRAQSDPYKQQ